MLTVLAAALPALAARILPGFLLSAWKTYNERKLATETDQRKHVHEERLSAIENETERRKIASEERKEAMGFPMFWVPWSIASVTLSTWFGWGVLDSLTNGALPDVATLPPQLKEYADSVWNSVFVSGAGMGGAQVIARAIARRR